jgi:hypothetical protein
MVWRTESCRQTQHRKMRDVAHCFTLSENYAEWEIIGSDDGRMYLARLRASEKSGAFRLRSRGQSAPVVVGMHPRIGRDLIQEPLLPL